MLDEEALRRPEFRPGIPARLGDGRVWMLPAPADIAAGATADPEYGALLSGVCEAEGPAERLRAELALAIYLLGINYDLSPAHYAAILDPPAGGPAPEALQQAFREAALAHVGHLRARSAADDDTAPRAHRPGAWARRRTANPAG